MSAPIPTPPAPAAPAAAAFPAVPPEPELSASFAVCPVDFGSNSWVWASGDTCPVAELDSVRGDWGISSTGIAAVAESSGDWEPLAAVAAVAPAAAPPAPAGAACPAAELAVEGESVAA